MKGHGELCTCPRCRPDLYPPRFGKALALIGLLALTACSSPKIVEQKCSVTQLLNRSNLLTEAWEVCWTLDEKGCEKVTAVRRQATIVLEDWCPEEVE